MRISQPSIAKRFLSALAIGAAICFSLAPSTADAATVRASSLDDAKMRIAHRVAGVLENLLRANGLSFEGDIRLVAKSGYHAEAFFGKPGFIQLGESYAESLDDGELTFVLAHELAHLMTDHAERVRQFYSGRVSAGLASPSDLHHALEAEADRLGLQWATQAGARAEQAVSALQRAYGRAAGSFSTHPALDSRTAALLTRR